MAAAAAAAPSSGGTGNNSTAAATTTTSRFAAACGALSQYVKATAEADRTRARPPVMRPLPLMPGADVDQLEEPAETAAAAQLTIVYGGRALVLGDVTADRAADLLRLAAAAVARGGGTDQQPLTSVAVADLPVARKASLQRFMEKRKGRVAARAEAPYRRPAGDRRDNLTLAL